MTFAQGKAENDLSFGEKQHPEQNIPEPEHGDRAQLSQGTWPPNGLHMLLIGPPLYSLFQKRHHLRGLPSHRKYPQ